MKPDSVMDCTRGHSQPSSAWLRAMFGMFLLLAALLLGTQAQAGNTVSAQLTLTAKADAFDAWSSARVLPDPEGRLSAEQAMSRLAEFEVAKVPANLGRRSGAAWIAVPIQREGDAPRQWVLAMDYPSLDRIDLYWHRAGQLSHLTTLGDSLPQRPDERRGRSPSWPVHLSDEAPQLLLMRVETVGSMVVPIMFYTPDRHQEVEASEQALQGMLAGAALCLLVYSLTQWAMLRTPAFGFYALTLIGTGCFFAALSGMGAQHVWGSHEWLTRNAPPFFILVGVTGAFFFTLSALDVDQVSPRIGKFVRFCGVVSGTAATAFWFDLIGYQTAQAIGMALGPAPLMLVLRVAVQRVREGDRGAAYLLAGWGCYSIGVLLLVGMLQGALPVNFWTTHGFQFASMVEMTTWLLVLGQRVHAIRQLALKAQAEHDRVQLMANTDPLTGLLNRRGLTASLETHLLAAKPDSLVALYVIDLDGFKGVNDRHGHEAGDALLVGMAQRLKSQVRSKDLVCRLGGDEFIVVAIGLPDERVARMIGQKLMSCTHTPLQAGDALCTVGMTIGYALSPQDDTDAASLIKRADEAMYVGKRAGRNALTHAAGPSATAHA
jgi:diguanylate cyclase